METEIHILVKLLHICQTEKVAKFALINHLHHGIDYFLHLPDNLVESSHQSRKRIPKGEGSKDK